MHTSNNLIEILIKNFTILRKIYEEGVLLFSLKAHQPVIEAGVKSVLLPRAFSGPGGIKDGAGAMSLSWLIHGHSATSPWITFDALSGPECNNAFLGTGKAPLCELCTILHNDILGWSH